MVDMKELERQVAGEVVRAVGPVRPVDDLSVYRAVHEASRPRGWRLQTMFSTTKFFVGGAIVALFVGFLYASVATAPRGDEPAPAAATQPDADAPTVGSVSAEPVDFHGTYPNFVTDDAGTMVLSQDGFIVTGDIIKGTFTDLDDPRLNGAVRYVINRIDHSLAGDVASYVMRIDNDDGSWLGRGYGYNDTSGGDLSFDAENIVDGLFDTTVLRGTDGYEGLTAIMVNLPTEDGLRVQGVVFPGEMPELPELPHTAE